MSAGMSPATLSSSVLAPQAPGGLKAGATLALGVHAALIAALTLGVDWRMHEPEPPAVSAELWASVPRVEPAEPAAEPLQAAVNPAPPPAPQPSPLPAAPPPPPPDIALERDRLARVTAREQAREQARKAAAERAEAQRAQAAAAQEKAADERLARQREENLRRMLGQAGAAAAESGAPSADARAAASARGGNPSPSYAGRVKAAILPHIVYTGQIRAGALAEVEVSLAPGGTVIARRLIKKSGLAEWDEAVLRAIDRTPRLPADVDGRVPPTLILSFRPGE